MFTVALSAPINTTISAGRGIATGTIDDNDGALSLSIDDASASEAAGTVDVTIRLNTASASDVTVDYTTSIGDGVNPATAADFTDTSGTATIPAGQTSATFAVALTNDALDEEDEAFIVTLSNPSAGTLSDSQAQITIQDDDAAPTVTISASTSAAEGTTASLAVTLAAASGKTVTVDFATDDGTATSGADYTAASGTLTFSPGQTTQTVSIALLTDAVIEGDETFDVAISAPTNATVGAVVSGRVTILDSNGALSISTADVSASESAGSASVTISLNSAAASDVTVSYGTQIGTATAADFTATSGVATIAAGQTSTTVPVLLTNDALDEVDEVFTLTLSNPSLGTLGQSASTVTILDDDDAPGLVIAGGQASESDATLGFTVTLGAASGKTVTVDYATQNGSATAGMDYTSTSGSLTFAPGITTQTFAVALIDDAIIEGGESFEATLSNAVNAAITTGMATGALVDDDGALTVSVERRVGGRGRRCSQCHHPPERCCVKRRERSLRDLARNGNRRRLLLHEWDGGHRSRSNVHRHRGTAHRRRSQRGCRDVCVRDNQSVDRSRRNGVGHRHDHRQRPAACATDRRRDSQRVGR